LDESEIPEELDMFVKAAKDGSQKLSITRDEWIRIGKKMGWLGKEAKVKARNRPNPVFDSTHPKVKDNKDDFPLGSIDQARNALARANQYSAAPSWYKGSLEELKNAVARAVKKAFPSIEVSKKSTD
jgi:hypothetical protein